MHTWYRWEVDEGTVQLLGCPLLIAGQLAVLLGKGRISGQQRLIRPFVRIVHAAVSCQEAVPVRLVEGGLGEGERAVGARTDGHQAGHGQERVHLRGSSLLSLEYGTCCLCKCRSRFKAEIQ